MIPSFEPSGDEASAAELEDDLPFLEIDTLVADVFDQLITFFATDQFMIRKGVVEVVEWN